MSPSDIASLGSSIHGLAGESIEHCGHSRRALIAGSLAVPVLAATALAETQTLDATRDVQQELRNAKSTKLVILGSASGPVPGRKRRMASNVMLSKGSAYVLDCGLGVTDQFAQTGIPFNALKSIFITHHHPDHNVEYGPLLLIGWVQGLPLSVQAFGPPLLKQMTDDLLRAYQTTIDFWAQDLKLPPLRSVVVNEVSATGDVTQDQNVKVSTAVVNHPPVRPALAYRFDFHDRSIVFSGDTTPVDAVVELAKGADVLVHEAILMKQTEAYMRSLIAHGRPGNIETFMAHMRADHSPVEEVGRIAQQAGVKTLVLSHLAGAELTASDDEWRVPAAKYFKGEIIVAHDMLVV